MKLLLNWLISTAAILIAGYVLPGVHVDGILVALVLAIVLGALNLFLKPILLILTLPITLITLGLFALVINALLILLADVIVPRFEVDGFLWALLFSLVLACINAVFHRMARPHT